MKNRLHHVSARTVTALASAIAMLPYPPSAMATNTDESDPSSAWAKNVADMDITELVNVRVSPFDVSTRLDNGYLASNSVSGSRIDAPIRDLPFAIQAFTDTFIRDQKPRNLFDVARYSPGVTYRSNDFTEGNANLSIRGFAISGSPGGVQTLRDGHHGPSILDFTNIARVEVVKGPASFLYGQVAPGGIVNVITKTPQPQFAATVDATAGTGSQHRLDADITGPASTTLFYRLAASHDQDMDYWKPYNAHSRSIAPSLLWQPNERLSVAVKYEDFSKVESPQVMQKPGYNTQAGVVPTAADPNLSGVDVPGLPDNWNSMANADFRHSESRNLSAWLDFRAGDNWNLRAGYSRLDYEVDSLFSGNLGMADNTTLWQGRRVRRQIYANHDSTYEAQAVGKYRFGDTSLRLLLGAQYVDRRFDNWAAQAPNDPALGNTPTASPLPLWNLADPGTWNREATVPHASLTANPTHQTTRYRDKSIYGGTTFGFFADRLLALAGWRWTSTESQLTNHLTGQSQPVIATRAVTPQYGALYRLTPEISFFASHAESFVPGTNLLRNPDGTTSIPRPTEGKGYDVGLKADLADRRFSGTITFFDVRNKNIVNDLAVTDASGSVTIYNVQSGEQRSRGVEVDMTITPDDNWQVYLSYSRMKARITDFSGNDAAILAQDPATLDAAGQANYKNVLRFHDAPLQMSAPHLANLWARYNFTGEGLRGFYVAGGINYVRDQVLLPDGPPSSHQTYGLINALIGYAWAAAGRRMNIELMGKNLADERYRPSQSTRGRPREFLLTFTARF